MLNIYIVPEKELDQFLNSSIKCNSSHGSWFPHPPWKRRDDLFDDKPYSDSGNGRSPMTSVIVRFTAFDLVDYFGIGSEDNNNITTESYLESPKFIVCKELILNFYSRIRTDTNTDLILSLFMYQQGAWHEEWQFVVNDTEWHLTQLKFNISEQSNDVQV